MTLCFDVYLADRLPYSIRILLESAIRNCDEFQVKAKDVEKIIDWENSSPKQVEIPFKPARVLLQVYNFKIFYVTTSHFCTVGDSWMIDIALFDSQDFTGVPAVVDLACMRDAMNKLGGDSNKINPLVSCIPIFYLVLDKFRSIMIIIIRVP